MDGRVLRHRLAEMRPGVPTVFMSGYPDRDQADARHGPLPGDKTIGKPFTSKGLLSTVRHALNNDAPDAS